MKIKTLEITAGHIIRSQFDYSIFEVITLPSVFALGKSAIKFRVRDGSLMQDSAIGFVAEDYYGRRISYDVLDFVDENACRIVAIDITKKTAAGISQIAFYGTMPSGKYAAMILKIPVDKSDVVAIAPMYVKAPAIILTEISASVVNLEIPQIEDESDLSGGTMIEDPTYPMGTRRRYVSLDMGNAEYQTSSNTSGGRNSTDVSKRFQTLSYLDDGGRVAIAGKVLYMDSSETYIKSQYKIFTRDMVGGRLVFKEFETNIIEVLSDRCIKIFPPFGYTDTESTSQAAKLSDFSGIVSVEYNDDVITDTTGSVVEGFLKIEYEGINPDSGDLSTIEVLGKGVGSLNPPQVIADIPIASQSVLIDEGRDFVGADSGGRFGKIGSDLLDYDFFTYWVETGIDVSVNSDPKKGRTTGFHRGVALEMMSEQSKIATVGSYRFRKGSVYRLTARFSIVENVKNDNSVYITIAGKDVRTNEKVDLPHNYNEFIANQGIKNTEVIFAKSVNSGSIVVDELFEFNGTDDGQVEVHFDASASVVQMEYIDIEVDSENHRPCNTYTAIVPIKGLLNSAEYNFTSKFKSSHGLYSNTEVEVNGFMVSGQESQIPSGSLQTLAYDSGSGELSISGGNTVIIRPGAATGDANEILYFTGSASTSWISSHSLNKIPSIDIFILNDGLYSHGRSTIVESSTTDVSVEFRYPQRGFLVLN